MKEKDIIFLEKLGFQRKDNTLFKEYQNKKTISVDMSSNNVSFRSKFMRKLDVSVLKDMLILSYLDRYYGEDKKKFEIDKVYSFEEETYRLDIKDGDKAVVIIATKDVNEYFDAIKRFMYNEFPLFECLIKDGINYVAFVNAAYSKKVDKVIFNEQIITVQELKTNYKLNDSTYKDPLYSLNEMMKQQEKMAKKVNTLRKFKFKVGNFDQGYKKFSIEFNDNYVLIQDNDYHSVPNKITSKVGIQAIKDEISDFYIQDWNKSYVSEMPFSDCYEWMLTLEFENEEKISHSGVNSFPKNWDKLFSFLRKYTELFNYDEDDL